LRIGILGGSFDPVHRGHEALAKLALDTLKLDELRFLPARNPPHKAGFCASDADRLAMLEYVVSGNSRYSIDQRELNSDRVSYTVLTLRELRAELGEDAQLYFVIGWDSLTSLQTWWNWRELTSLANLAVAHRPGIDITLDAELEAYLKPIWDTGSHSNASLSTASGRLVSLRSTNHELSSSKIRAALAASTKSHEQILLEQVDRYLSEEVANYALERGLYRFINKTESNRHLS